MCLSIPFQTHMLPLTFPRRKVVEEPTLLVVIDIQAVPPDPKAQHVAANGHHYPLPAEEQGKSHSVQETIGHDQYCPRPVWKTHAQPCQAFVHAAPAAATPRGIYAKFLHQALTAA